MYPEIIIGNLTLNSTNVFHLIGSIGLLIYCVFTRKRYNISKMMAVIYSVVLVGAGLVEFQIMGRIQSILIELVSNGELVLNSSRRILGVLVFQPIFIYLLSLFTGDRFRKLADFIAAGTFICFVFGKIACFMQGCCHGFPDEKGLFSAEYGGNVFPVQLYESISTIFVVIVLTVLLSKRFRLRVGSLFPIGSILYSVIRLFWENFRYYDNQWEEDFFLKMNFWQFWCIIVIIISIIWLIILYKKTEYAECDFEKDSKAIMPVLLEKSALVIEKIKHRNDKNIVHHNKNKKKYQKK